MFLLNLINHNICLNIRRHSIYKYSSRDRKPEEGMMKYHNLARISRMRDDIEYGFIFHLEKRNQGDIFTQVISTLKMPKWSMVNKKSGIHLSNTKINFNC